MTFLVSNIVPLIVKIQIRRHLDIIAVEHRNALSAGVVQPARIQTVLMLPTHVQSNFRTIHRDYYRYGEGRQLDQIFCFENPSVLR